MHLRTLAMLMLAVALATAAAGQRRGAEVRVPVTRDSMLVSTDWLMRHLQDPDVVILEIGHERKGYDQGHIPGARFVALSDIAVTRHGVPNELPPAADLKKVFERAGVSDRSRVILYDGMSGLLAARAFFTLDYAGHGERTALLDGGMEKWRADRLPLSTEAPTVKPGTFTPAVHPEVLVPLPVVRDFSWEVLNVPRAPVVLADARPAEEFAGAKSAAGGPRAGHIPGAVSLYWMKTLESKDNPELLPPAELRKVFADAGISPAQRVVTYCNSGVQASFLYFVARYLGYDAALYDGSMSEWSKAPDTEVVPSPK